MLLVAYDIPDDRRRARVMKALARLGRRVQYSVFLLLQSTPEQIAAELGPLIDAREDDVRIHPLCGACEKKAVLLGLATVVVPERGFRVI